MAQNESDYDFVINNRNICSHTVSRQHKHNESSNSLEPIKNLKFGSGEKDILIRKSVRGKQKKSQVPYLEKGLEIIHLLKTYSGRVVVTKEWKLMIVFTLMIFTVNYLSITKRPSPKNVFFYKLGDFENICRYTSQESRRYAVQNGRKFDLDGKDVEEFFGILFYMGLVKLPSIRDY